MFQKLQALYKANPDQFDEINSITQDQMFEEKYQTERLSRKLKAMIEKEFIGLKTDLTVDFDERVIQVVDKIERMVEMTVERKVEELKKDVLVKLFPVEKK